MLTHTVSFNTNNPEEVVNFLQTLTPPKNGTIMSDVSVKELIETKQDLLFGGDVGEPHTSGEPTFLGVGPFNLSETKPEEKPCDHKNASISYGPDGWFCSRCGVHKYETKPEEKPTYWYIETEEMKKSEYWEVFREWWKNKDKCEPYFQYKILGYDGDGYYETDVCPNLKFLLSPQQWYDTIFDGDKTLYCFGKYPGDAKQNEEICIGKGTDHDKVMEIPEVYNPWEEYNGYIPRIKLDGQIELLTNSLNAVIKKINNL